MFGRAGQEEFGFLTAMRAGDDHADVLGEELEAASAVLAFTL